MILHFIKYQGTGNDFIIVDNRNGIADDIEINVISDLCDRKFGIGADGFILIEKHTSYDFQMKYFNADGSRSFCGNGSRCAVHFANTLGMCQNEEITFEAIDGKHYARIVGDEIHIRMNDVTEVEFGDDYYYLNTGSPHYISFVENLTEMDIVSEAKKVRYNDRFKEVGTNVNFVQKGDSKLDIRTYERGVEDETLSCGTGATAVAIASFLKGDSVSPTKIGVEGGELQIIFEKAGSQHFTNIWLCGPATSVYTGSIEL